MKNLKDEEMYAMSRYSRTFLNCFCYNYSKDYQEDHISHRQNQYIRLPEITIKTEMVKIV